MSTQTRSPRTLLGAAATRRGIIVLAAALIVAVLIIATGGDPLVAVGGWFRGAFGTGYNLTQTLVYAVPLALIGIGVSGALRAGIITVGAEGQMIAGAIAATATSLFLGPDVPIWLALPLGAGVGALAGAAWAFLPALGRARWGVNEILATLLANYLALYLLKYLLRTSLRDPGGSATPQSAQLPDPFLLPQLPVPGRLHAGILILLIIVAVAVYLGRGKRRFLQDVYGQRPLLAARAGYDQTRAVFGTMLVSGAFAGLAGWMQLAGVDERLQPGISAGIGFAGIAVCVLGRGAPLGILAAAIAYASLTTGANGIQVATGTTPAAIGTVSQGILLLAAALIIAIPVVRRTRKPATGSAAQPGNAAPTETSENTKNTENTENTEEVSDGQR